MNPIDISINPVTDQLNRAAHESASTISSLSGVDTHDIAIVLGSGWVPAAERIGTHIAEFSVSEVPHFSEPAVAGHSGKIRSVDINGKKILVFLGRTHFYEGKGVDAVTHIVRTAAASGCTTMILTNGCGGLNPRVVPRHTRIN